mmetsp:Transcript_26920/g.63875  ORF Transcript_26920/g.63875 Transcript_26920/m.63875 type:complete len:490 (-) Transcript_26920:210-1679(-)
MKRHSDIQKTRVYAVLYGVFQNMGGDDGPEDGPLPTTTAALDRTDEFMAVSLDIFMGRDPKRQRLGGDDPRGRRRRAWGTPAATTACRSAPGCVAINLAENLDDDDSLEGPCRDGWMDAALALSSSIDGVSDMIRTSAASYGSSADVLRVCLDDPDGGSSDGGEPAMSGADRSLLETTAASMAPQIEQLRRTIPADPPGGAAETGPSAHRAGIAACLVRRLKVEVVERMAGLQSRRVASSSSSGEVAGGAVRNPLGAFGLLVPSSSAGEDGRRRPPPPAPWEAGSHDPDRDRAEREEEERDYLAVYGRRGHKPPLKEVQQSLVQTMNAPPSVLGLMDLPDPGPNHIQLQAPTPQQRSLDRNREATAAAPSVRFQEQYEDDEADRTDRLQRESAALLATYQHADLDSVHRVESSMSEITQLLSRFTDLIAEQAGDVAAIHGQAVRSRENVDKGQDQLVDAATRGEKSRHPMATFIVASAVLLLFFNWITP